MPKYHVTLIFEDNATSEQEVRDNVARLLNRSAYGRKVEWAADVLVSEASK